MYTSTVAILVYNLLCLVREAYNLKQQKWHYLVDPSNRVSWILYISSTQMVFPTLFNTTSDVQVCAIIIKLSTRNSFGDSVIDSGNCIPLWCTFQHWTNINQVFSFSVLSGFDYSVSLLVWAATSAPALRPDWHLRSHVPRDPSDPHQSPHALLNSHHCLRIGLLHSTV